MCQEVVTQSSWTWTGGDSHGVTAHYLVNVVQHGCCFLLKISTPLPGQWKAYRTHLFQPLSPSTKRQLEFHDNLISVQPDFLKPEWAGTEVYYAKRSHRGGISHINTWSFASPKDLLPIYFCENQRNQRKSHFGPIRFAGGWMGRLEQSESIFTFVCMPD